MTRIRSRLPYYEVAHEPAAVPIPARGGAPEVQHHRAARALHTSQPGISKAIIELENELGVPILARSRQARARPDAAGPAGAVAAERIMQDVDNLKKLARDFAGSPEGTLRVATTHTQARYVLPQCRAAVRAQVPEGAAQDARVQSVADCRDARQRPGRRRHGHRDARRLRRGCLRFPSTTGSTSPSCRAVTRWRSSRRRRAS